MGWQIRASNTQVVDFFTCVLTTSYFPEFFGEIILFNKREPIG
jgi:hypothetical protein